jgi:beta-glucosidase
MRRYHFVIIAAVVFSTTAASQQYPFNNTKLSFEKRVTDLVGRLTLEEKVAQMSNTTPAIDRLGIPAYNWWNEILHGVARTPFKVTVYPQAIAMAATFDSNAIYKMADYSALEGRAIQNKAIEMGKTKERYWGLTYWTPNINIFRDPRWGRGQETYGEDPFLTAMMAKAFVRGLQGDDPKYLKAAACAKHYAVHSGPEPTRHAFNAEVSDYDLWDTYLPAFHELVTNAHVAGVMCAYNALRTQPCCGNDLLMTDILRNQWKFTGYVTSDCGAIDDFFNFHKTHSGPAVAAADAVYHGTDVDCGNQSYKTLVTAVKEGLITEKQLDVSVRRLFMIRFRLGMFDPPSMVKYAQTPASTLEAPEHQEHSLKMARESIVLLRNENHLLPLSKNLNRVLVLGPNADNSISLLGNYNGTPSKIVTILDGIKQKLGGQATVVYRKAINFTNDTVQNENRKDLIEEAAKADVIIFAGGISPQLEGEEMKVDYPGFHGGDRTSIMLPAVQTTLLQELSKTNKPIVFIMLTGSAIAIPWESQHIPAILNAWYGGQFAGTAVADALFGDYNPAGRLPVTFYASDSDIPDFSSYDMTNRTYRYFKGKPLFPFGYGLSYTTFKYEQLQLPGTTATGKNVLVSARITNTGSMDGEEVVQVYVSHDTKEKAPIRALKGFRRIFLKKGESRIVKFILTVADLSITDSEGKYREPKGNVRISIGGGQPLSEYNATSNYLIGITRIR